jgi:hypothetical protein
MICFADDPQREARSRNAYDTLLKKAVGNVTNLAMPLPEGAANEAARHRAYDSATKYMLERSDLLIALVDVLHRKDLGMTGDAVRYAIRLGIGIIWIDPFDPKELKWLGHLTEEQFIAITAGAVGQRVVAPVVSHESVSKALSHQVASVVQSKCAALRLDPE